MYKHIVVPIDVDHAERGTGMLAEAKKLCGTAGKVTVVNVVEDVPGLLSAELPDELVTKAAHEARDAAAAIGAEQPSWWVTAAPMLHGKLTGPWRD